MARNALKPLTHLGVDARMDKVVIPTYLAGPEDPNPTLFGKGVKAVYPYTSQDSFTQEIRDRTYDALVLTSGLMEVTILPDWGMHLYRAIDRTTGRDMFHCPAVMKPANNAIRGAYVAGGVEMNFPIGHNAMTWSRARIHLHKTPEGIRALFVHIDRRSGTSMAAGVTLTGDYRGLRFDQYLFNPTPLPQPWYYWLNAGLAPHSSLKFLFPTSQMLGHFGSLFLETCTKYPYPIRNGVDYSSNIEGPEPVGLFSPTGQPGWFGAWYDHWQFGVMRWAQPWEVAGQKFWSWGNSEEGLLWGKIAADMDMPIPEIQSGRPETQMDRGVLAPYASTSHSEWWFPASDIPGVKAASRYGAMTFEPQGPATRVYISPTEAVQDCRIRANGQVFGDSVDLSPGQRAGWTIEVQAQAIKALELLGAGGVLITWSDTEAPLAANVEGLYDNPKPLDQMSGEELFEKGFRYERKQRPDLARRCYEKALVVDSSQSKAHLHLGLLDLYADDPDAALQNLAKTLLTDRQNDEALYLHGLASEWTGQDAQAEADFCRAAATGSIYVVPAIVRLAVSALQSGDLLRAESIIDSGLAGSPAQPYLLWLKSVRARRQGNITDTEGYCSQIHDRLGESLLIELEEDFAGVRDRVQVIRAADETEDELLIATALHYIEAGATEDAISLLGKAASPIGQARAAYLCQWLGGPCLAPDGKHRFFGWGRPMRLALESALVERPDDFTANFALGCLLAELGHLDSAAAHLCRAVASGPSDSVARTALGEVYLRVSQSAESAAELEEAIAGKPVNPKAWVLLDRVLGQTGRRDSAWLARFSQAPPEVLADEKACETLARLMVDLGKFDAAANVLSARVFHPYELGHGLRGLWSRAHLDKAVASARSGDYDQARKDIAKALEYPENLQLGRPLRRSDAKTLYVASLIETEAGDLEAAQAHLAQAIQQNQSDPVPTEPWSILAMIRLGEKQAAMKRLEAVKSQVRLYLESQFQPDLNDRLQETLEQCRMIREGWLPELKDISDAQESL